jgi:hypothetical protein
MEKLFQIIKKNPALVITAISAIGYLFAYLFQLGQCKYFHIPDNFIEVDLKSILSFASIAVAYSVLILAVVTWIFHIFDNLAKTLAQKITIAIVAWPPFIIPSLILLTDISGRSAILATAVFIIIQSLTLLAIQLYNRRHKFDTSQKNYETKNTEPMYYFYAYCILFGVIGMMAFISWLGYMSASNKQMFYTLRNKNDNLVLLKQFGDKIFCKEYDIKSKKLKDSIVIINMNQTPTIKLTSQRIKINQ